MAEVLINARPPLCRALAEVLPANGIRFECQSVSDILRRLRQRADEFGHVRAHAEADRVAAAEPQEKPPFLLIVQEVDREELRWLSRSRERFASSPAEDGEWSGHPLLFRDLRGIARQPADIERLGDCALIARLAAYSVPIVFVGVFALPDSRSIEAVDDADLLFLDSSIWHRYVALFEPEGLGRICARIKECEQLYEAGRYSLAVAVEFLEFSVRSLRELYLLRSPEEGNHGDFVALHGFHSETERAQNAAELQKQLSGLSPRYLLVDDYAAKGLRSAYGTAVDTKLSKGCVIRTELGIDCEDGDCFEWCESYASGVKRLEIDAPNGRKPVDIILLDYLLEKKDEEGRRWRGIDVLSKLADTDAGAGRSGTLGGYWVLPVSSFPTVFLAELQSGRLGNIERNLTMVAGADPVCTPALFRFRVWDLVEAIRDRARLEVADLEKLFIAGLAIAQALEQESGPDHWRLWARSLYALVSRKRESYDQVKSDAVAGSRLAAHILQTRQGDHLADILDHLESVLRYLGWGGTLRPLEALDRLLLVSALLKQPTASPELKHWNDLETRLQTAIGVVAQSS